MDYHDDRHLFDKVKTAYTVVQELELLRFVRYNSAASLIRDYESEIAEKGPSISSSHSQTATFTNVALIPHPNVPNAFYAHRNFHGLPPPNGGSPSPFTLSGSRSGFRFVYRTRDDQRRRNQRNTPDCYRCYDRRHGRERYRSRSRDNYEDRLISPSRDRASHAGYLNRDKGRLSHGVYVQVREEALRNNPQARAYMAELLAPQRDLYQQTIIPPKTDKNTTHIPVMPTSSPSIAQVPHAINAEITALPLEHMEAHVVELA